MKNIKIKLLILILGLSAFFTLSAQGRFGITYNTALPLGETSDYIGNFSFRGAGIEARWEVAQELYVGFNTSWNVFYESVSGSFTEGTRTLTGTQYRYLNSYPLMFTAFKGFGELGAFSPYAGLGIGGIKVDRRSEMGLWQHTENKWHFGLAPEIGTLIYTWGNFDILFSIRYNYAFKTGDTPAYSYLGINLGILL
jgi:opacity protein-like surface antigen